MKLPALWEIRYRYAPAVWEKILDFGAMVFVVAFILAFMTLFGYTVGCALLHRSLLP